MKAGDISLSDSPAVPPYARWCASAQVERRNHVVSGLLGFRGTVKFYHADRSSRFCCPCIHITADQLSPSNHDRALGALSPPRRLVPEHYSSGSFS